MEHHPVAEIAGLLRRDAGPQLLLHLQGVLGPVRQPQQAGDPDAVGVADVARLAVHVPQDQVGGLAAHAGQPQQVLHIVRHPAAEIRQQHLRRGHDIPGLGPPEAAGADVFPHLLRAGGGKGLQGRKPGKQRRGHLVHPGVGALGRQAHGKQQLIVLSIVQGTRRVGIQLLQPPDDGGHLLGRFHNRSPRPYCTRPPEKMQIGGAKAAGVWYNT